MNAHRPVESNSINGVWDDRKGQQYKQVRVVAALDADGDDSENPYVSVGYCCRLLRTSNWSQSK